MAVLTPSSLSMTVTNAPGKSVEVVTFEQTFEGLDQGRTLFCAFVELNGVVIINTYISYGSGVNRGPGGSTYIFAVEVTSSSSSAESSTSSAEAVSSSETTTTSGEASAEPSIETSASATGTVEESSTASATGETTSIPDNAGSSTSASSSTSATTSTPFIPANVSSTGTGVALQTLQNVVTVGLCSVSV